MNPLLLGSGNAPAAPPSGTRARPTVSGGTIRTDTGQLLRGATIDLRFQTNPPSSQDAVWKRFRSYGLNVCRFGVKTNAGGQGRPLAQQLPYMDVAVDLAEANRMYIMPMPSITPGSYNLAHLTSFWQTVAPRYANRPHVLYELTNEPTQGSPNWGCAAQWTATVLSQLRSVRDIMRAAAPQTPIVNFSSTNICPSASAWNTVATTYAGLNTPFSWGSGLDVLGYHHYNGTWALPGPFTSLHQLQTGTPARPIFMTECNGFIGDGASSDPRNVREVWLSYEQNAISWVHLDGKDGVGAHIRDEVLPYLAANGYALVPE